MCDRRVLLWLVALVAARGVLCLFPPLRHMCSRSSRLLPVHSRLVVTGWRLTFAFDVSSLGFALTGYAGGGEVLPVVAGRFVVALSVALCLFPCDWLLLLPLSFVFCWVILERCA